MTSIPTNASNEPGNKSIFIPNPASYLPDIPVTGNKTSNELIFIRTAQPPPGDFALLGDFPNEAGELSANSSPLGNSIKEPGGFAVLDFETGGVEPRRHALLSVGLILLDRGLQEVASLYTLIQDSPSRLVTPEALAINQIDMNEVRENGVPVDSLLAALWQLLPGRTIVCHNATFDTRFLNDRGWSITEAVDTMFLAWDIWPFPQKVKLEIVAERLGVEHSGAHNSLIDARMTANILRKMPAIHPDHEKCLQPRRILYDYYPRKIFTTRNLYV